MGRFTDLPKDVKWLILVKTLRYRDMQHPLFYESTSCPNQFYWPMTEKVLQRRDLSLSASKRRGLSNILAGTCDSCTLKRMPLTR
jgi:hypothetical protein